MGRVWGKLKKMSSPVERWMSRDKSLAGVNLESGRRAIFHQGVLPGWKVFVFLLTVLVFTWQLISYVGVALWFRKLYSCDVVVQEGYLCSFSILHFPRAELYLHLITWEGNSWKGIWPNFWKPSLIAQTRSVPVCKDSTIKPPLETSH